VNLSNFRDATPALVVRFSLRSARDAQGNAVEQTVAGSAGSLEAVEGFIQRCKSAAVSGQPADPY